MLLLALGGEASRAHMDLLEFSRPPGKPWLTDKQIIQAESKCHANICRAACKCCREVSTAKGKDGNAAWGAEGCRRMQTFCRGFSSLCVSRICFVSFSINLCGFPTHRCWYRQKTKSQSLLSVLEKNSHIILNSFPSNIFIYLFMHLFNHSLFLFSFLYSKFPAGFAVLQLGLGLSMFNIHNSQKSQQLCYMAMCSSVESEIPAPL